MPAPLPRLAVTAALVLTFGGCAGSVDSPQSGPAGEASASREASTATPPPAEAAAEGALPSTGDVEPSGDADVTDEAATRVRAFSPTSVGICTAEGKQCGTFLGLSATLDDPGEYILWAELAVPPEPAEGWPVEFSTTCTVTVERGGATDRSTRSNSRTYTVQYGGTERGYRLGLWRMQSPEAGGSRECTWSLRVPHPGGDDTTWEGRWSIPQDT